MKRRILLLLCAVLASCAAPYTLPPLPPDHPASPEAAEAPAPPVSRSLVDVAAPPLPREPGADGASDPDAGHDIREPRHGGHP